MLRAGFHTASACVCDGIGEFINKMNADGLGAVAKSVDATSSLFDSINSPLNETILRVSTGFDGRDDDVPIYGGDIESEAEIFWSRGKEFFDSTGLPKERVWIELLNEMDKDSDDNVRWIAELKLAIAKKAVADGYKVMLGGWSAGTPEPHQWESPEMLAFLEYAAHRPNQVAVSLHEYSYEMDLESGVPQLIGRFRHMFDACDRAGIAHPTTFITEFGWAYRDAPDAATAMSQMQDIIPLYSAYPAIRGLSIWALDRDPKWDQLPVTINSYMDPLHQLWKENKMAVTQPDNGVPTTPQPPSGGDEDNILISPCFDKGWTSLPPVGDLTNQSPLGWRLEVVPAGEPLFGLNYREADGTEIPAYSQGVPECVHKLQRQLPEDEWPGGEDEKILCVSSVDVDPEHGPAVFKVFGRFAHGVELHLDQEIANGRYELSINVQKKFHCGLDPDIWNAAVLINTSGKTVVIRGDNMPEETWVNFTHQFDYTGGELSIGIASLYPNCATDTFMDKWSLKLIEETDMPDEPTGSCCEPRVQYDRVYNVISPDATDDEAVAIFLKGWREGKQTAGGSYDDAMYGCLNSKKAVLHGIPEERHAEFLAWRDEHYPGTEIVFQ